MVRHRQGIALAFVLALALIVAVPASGKYARALPGIETASTPAVDRTAPTPVVDRAAGATSVDRTAAAENAQRSGATNNDFHWGDAGIGAGSALVLTGLLVVAVITVPGSRRRIGRVPARPTP
jgi:hypothetical protein